MKDMAEVLQAVGVFGPSLGIFFLTVVMGMVTAMVVFPLAWLLWRSRSVLNIFIEILRKEEFQKEESSTSQVPAGTRTQLEAALTTLQQLITTISTTAATPEPTRAALLTIVQQMRNLLTRSP